MIFRDQLQREVTIPGEPQRIISLVPSITELLADLGLEHRIAGITRFCARPDSIYRSKPRVGGTKTPDLERIANLKPDLIIANKEENNQQDIERLQELAPVWVSDVSSLQQALDMILQIGEITNCLPESTRMADEIKSRFAELAPRDLIPVLYVIWKDPLMVAGSGTFIDDMMSYCGFTNVFRNHERYPVTTISQILDLRPRVCLLSSEPYPFTNKDVEAFGRMLPGINCVPVDGQIFSWYGSRLLHAPEYFHRLATSIPAAV
jgi:ABC-type Fe3+-hydroxamate transport system substrate-binding protein